MKSELIDKFNGNETKHLNKLLILTYRWLKVNEYSLKNFILPEISRYSKGYIQDGDFKNVIVQEMSNKIKVFNTVEDYFNKDKSYGVSEEFVKLAKELYNAGLVIHVPKGEKMSAPIKINFCADEKDNVVIDNNLIVAEENSEVTVIFEYNSDNDTESFHNGLTRIYARDGSVVNIIKLQTMNNKSLNIDSNAAYIGYGAKVNYISIEMGAGKSLTNYVNNLDEENSSSDLRSIYVGDENREIDLSYLMNHRGRRSISNIETKGVLKDNSKKIFKGTIDFKLGASKSKGAEEEYTILLDPTVKSDAVPLLLCSEDDVEGQHAASAGKINEDKLFYLMSRGLNEGDAKRLIVEASFRPIIDLIPDDKIRERIQNEVERRIVHEQQ